MNLGPEDHEDEDVGGSSSLEEFEDLVDGQLDDDEDDSDTTTDDDD